MHPSLNNAATGLVITNPLVLYRSLLATKRIAPDPAQHRLALHLQNVYQRLLDYEPQIDYKHRLGELTRAINQRINVRSVNVDPPSLSNISKLKHLFSKKGVGEPENRAVIRKVTNHEAASSIDSPQGLLLHGEVGTGKSMLIDLLANSLPNNKKRRWHFNTFMLEIFTKLERQRISRSIGHNQQVYDDDYPLLIVARDLVDKSPIIFLDEFQLPDRAASKILSNLLTSFFSLGGVLIASSNRMPEDLANAAGKEFAATPSTQSGRFSRRWRLSGQDKAAPGVTGGLSSSGDFANFLKVLGARCELMHMTGTKDWRRQETEAVPSTEQGSSLPKDFHYAGLEALSAGNLGLGFEQSREIEATGLRSSTSTQDLKLPYAYFLSGSTDKTLSDVASAENFESRVRQLVYAERQYDPKAPVQWETATLRIYGRNVTVPRQLSGIVHWTFDELCCSRLGPADYITLASTYHTFILENVPVLTFLHKNEARRLITLLDALYEARCKLMIRAAADPDDLFFPEDRIISPNTGARGHGRSRESLSSDETLPETFSEIYQDTTSPFRPNVSSYGAYTPQPSEQGTTRSILADEDSDFGPTYGAGRGISRGVSDGIPGAGNEIGKQIDFRNTGAFTGEDEKFAYKRASSRLWEMCGRRWWSRNGEDWWQPLSKEARHWEGKGTSVANADPQEQPDGATTCLTNEAIKGTGSIGDKLFRHGASPFRTSIEPPPKIGWTHAWGMMRWGKKAGTWGKGVEGLQDKKAKEEEQ